MDRKRWLLKIYLNIFVTFLWNIENRNLKIPLSWKTIYLLDRRSCLGWVLSTVATVRWSRLALAVRAVSERVGASDHHANSKQHPHYHHHQEEVVPCPLLILRSWQLRKAFNIVAVLLSLPQNTKDSSHNHLRTEDTLARIKLVRHTSTITYYYAVINLFVIKKLN